MHLFYITDDFIDWKRHDMFLKKEGALVIYCTDILTNKHLKPA